ncbi:hypothetical protein C7475_102827 [Chitinophaga sp. S165]|nr:hypothetical protein C7475_102827 [Chitinophaga sp. S165]
MICAISIRNIGDNLDIQLFTFSKFPLNVEKYLREKSS